MQTWTVGTQSDHGLIFQGDEDHVWLHRLLGLFCGWCGDDKGPVRTRGPAILSTDLGRCEGTGFSPVTREFGDDAVRIAWQAHDGALRLETAWALCPQTGVLSRRDRLVNTGSCARTVFRCLPRFTLPPGRYEVYAQNSRWSNENQGAWIPLHTGSLVFGCEWGRHTEGGTPYVCVREADRMQGLAFHVLPQGNWTIKVGAHGFSNQRPYAVVELGLADEDLRLKLQPGEALDLPEILVQELPGGEPHLAAPALHRYIDSRLPSSPARDVPVLYNTWFDRFHVLDVPRLRDQLRAAKDVGCEVFVVDAGWFGPGDASWGRVGDWREKTDCAFHGRMKEFADEVRAAGLGFGLWMEPERVVPGVPIREQHPEWFFPGEIRIDLENREAFDYLRSEIRRLIETYGLAWLKIDYNASLGLDTSGAELHGYYAAWCGLLDGLRTAYPGTIIENCASGAMRTDLSSVFHYDVHFPSDSVNPVDVLRIGQGALLRLPPGRIVRWAVLRSIGEAVAEYPLRGGGRLVTPCGATWNMTETATADFIVATALSGMLGFSGDLASLSPEPRTRIRWYVDFHKRWRRMLLTSVAHLLTPPRPITDRAGWTAIQSQDPDTGTSILFAYHLPNDGENCRRFPLRGLISGQVYSVQTTGPDGTTETTARGDALMRDGVTVTDPYMQHAQWHSAILVIEPKMS